MQNFPGKQLAVLFVIFRLTIQLTVYFSSRSKWSSILSGWIV
jgi:hypothetical protein